MHISDEKGYNIIALQINNVKDGEMSFLLNKRRTVIFIFVLAISCFFLRVNFSFADEEKNVSRKFAIGMPPAVTELGQSISLKYMFSEKWGAQTVLMYTDSNDDTPTTFNKSSKFGMEWRVLRKVATTGSMDIFTGFGYGTESEKSSSGNKDGSFSSSSTTKRKKTRLFFGGEYFFNEFPRLGFSFELGVLFMDADSDFGGTPRSTKRTDTYSGLFGVHYYFR